MIFFFFPMSLRMDVKHAVRNILPFGIGKVSETKQREAIAGEAKSSADRDADGKRQQEEKPPERNLTDEEIHEAIKILQSFPGVKDSALQFKLVREENGVPFVQVLDRDGKVVRRIAEAELSQVKARASGNKTTGNLLNKAM